MDRRLFTGSPPFGGSLRFAGSSPLDRSSLFFNIYAHRLCVGEPKKIIIKIKSKGFLFQRISVLVQRFNAVLLNDSFMLENNLD